MRLDERALLREFRAIGGKTVSGPDGFVSLRRVGSHLGIPPKRVCYLATKWSRKGWYDWGVSIDTGWLTPIGTEAAQAA